ncbi:hypothetical protein BJ165DRAFT_1611873 [Panaeolus papilionaceus]|nr:hypothetical protein BJ165DRAFT_1611873 [Panaeolus papilionaceus]
MEGGVMGHSAGNSINSLMWVSISPASSPEVNFTYRNSLLVSSHTTMAPTAYCLKSEKTLYYHVTIGEVPEGIVDTENGASGILTFSEPVHDKNAKVTIAGANGLFVALPPVR